MIEQYGSDADGFEEEVFGCWCGEEFDNVDDYEIHLEEHLNNDEEDPDA